MLTAFRASALAACCLGERFLCDLSKILFYAVEGRRQTLSSFPRAPINLTVDKALNLVVVWC